MDDAFKLLDARMAQYKNKYGSVEMLDMLPEKFSYLGSFFEEEFLLRVDDLREEDRKSGGWGKDVQNQYSRPLEKIELMLENIMKQFSFRKKDSWEKEKQEIEDCLLQFSVLVEELCQTDDPWAQLVAIQKHTQILKHSPIQEYFLKPLLIALYIFARIAFEPIIRIGIGAFQPLWRAGKLLEEAYYRTHPNCNYPQTHYPPRSSQAPLNSALCFILSWPITVVIFPLLQLYQMGISIRAETRHLYHYTFHMQRNKAAAQALSAFKAQAEKNLPGEQRKSRLARQS